MSEELNFRNELKKNKPEFKRQNYVSPRLEEKWRMPKGISSKLRRGFRGKGKLPSVGYSSPRNVSGLSRKGLKMVVVHNLKDLEGLTKENGVIISSAVGMKLRLNLLNKIKEKGLHVMGLKDVGVYLENIKKTLEEKKKEKNLRKDKRGKAKEEAAEKKEEKEKKDEHKDHKREEQKTEEKAVGIEEEKKTEEVEIGQELIHNESKK